MIEQLQNLDWVAIGTCAAACSGAIVAVISAIVNARKTARLEKALDDAKARQTQVLCPKCKKKSPLSEVSFVLPDGSSDNNLNGVPDHTEN